MPPETVLQRLSQRLRPRLTGSACGVPLRRLRLATDGSNYFSCALSLQAFQSIPTPHSHSIVNGSCKPLSHRELLSPSRNFTVRFTVNLTGIAENSFHHLSTSIEDDRRSCMSDLSRCIEIYRVQQHTMIASTMPFPRSRWRQTCTGIKRLNALASNTFRPLLLPARAICDVVRGP